MSHSGSSSTHTPVRRWRILTTGLVLILIAGLGFRDYRQMIINAKTPANGPVSRQVLMVAEDQIKASKPGPTIGALDYAYVAVVYDDILQTSGQDQALRAAMSMMEILFPSHASELEKQVSPIAEANHIGYIQSEKQLDVSAAATLQRYKDRYAHDGHTLQWDGTKPTGPGKWSSKTGAAPFTPRAGDWKRWQVTSPITVPPPPVYGSAEDKRQMSLVRQATSKRNGQDINVINFWAGQPGSETPGGIWQNVMYTKVRPDISTSATTADKQYAHLQSILAQSISDAFMECWKVKYTYWTARPDMRMPDIAVAMDDPNFPGYVSGHSTVSKAAADVLSVTVPRYADVWEADAMEARNSRLVAGIHFEIDNVVGFDVGTEVAHQYINNLHLVRSL